MLDHAPSIRGHLESTFPGSQDPLLKPNSRWFRCSGRRAPLEDQGSEATSQHRPHSRWRGASEVSFLVQKGLGAKARGAGRKQVVRLCESRSPVQLATPPGFRSTPPPTVWPWFPPPGHQLRLRGLCFERPPHWTLKQGPGAASQTECWGGGAWALDMKGRDAHT